MKAEDNSQKSEAKTQKTDKRKRARISKQKLPAMRKFLFYCFLTTIFCLLINCSIPNLEKPECDEARNDVRDFYSYHFGGEMKNTPDSLKRLDRFLSADLKKRLQKQQETAIDYFTQTDDYPKAFRVGTCEVVEPNKTAFDILIFWKTETRSEQRDIQVEAVKENDKWVVNKVETKH